MSWSAVAALVASFTASGLLLGAAIGLVWLLDRYDRASLFLAGGVFVWGLVLTPLLDAAARVWLGGGSNAAAGSIFFVLTGSTCQGLLMAVPLLLIALYSRSFDSPADGIVYGTSVGVASALSLVVTGQLTAAQVQPSMISHGVVDAVTTVGAHALSGAVAGVSVGAMVLARHTGARVGWIVAGLVLATAVHAGWELTTEWIAGSSGVVENRLAVAVVQSALYVAVLAGVLLTEQRILRARLKEEVDLATVPPWVVDVIPYFHRRVRSDWWPRRSERTVLSRLLTRLAFRRQALGRPVDEQARLAGLELVQLRHRIRLALGPSPPDDGC